MKNLGNSEKGADDVDTSGGLRVGIEDRLTEDILLELHKLSGSDIDQKIFRERIVTIIVRYDRYLVAFETTPKKKRRSQLDRIEKAAIRFLTSLETANQDVRTSLDWGVDDFEKSEWEEWTFDSGDPLPLQSPIVEQADTAVKRVLDATGAALGDLEQSKGEKPMPRQVALIQLIDGLAGCYEYGTGKAQKSGCYYDGTVGAYTGGFYDFVKAVLDWYHPRGYFSDQGLGKQIQRTLKPD